jgi:hypothetical protein
MTDAEDYSPHDDVGDVRWRWEDIRPQLQARLRAGEYRLGPVRRFHHGAERLKETGLTYARFMDDWVILAPTRWKLREAIRLVNQTLAELHVEQHPDA